MDEETGLYYYGARYLDPKYSRWLSGDPALGEYMSAYSVGKNVMIVYVLFLIKNEAYAYMGVIIVYAAI